MHGHIFRHLEANQENLWHLMVFLFLLCGHYVPLLEEIGDQGARACSLLAPTSLNRWVSWLN